MTDTKPDSARKGTGEFRMETRELHAEELNGDSEDYHADRYRELEVMAAPVIVLLPVPRYQ